MRWKREVSFPPPAAWGAVGGSERQRPGGVMCALGRVCARCVRSCVRGMQEGVRAPGERQAGSV